MDFRPAAVTVPVFQEHVHTPYCLCFYISVHFFFFFFFHIALDCFGKKVPAHRDIECIMIPSVLACNYLHVGFCKGIKPQPMVWNLMMGHSTHVHL